MSYGDESGYGSRRANYGDEETEGGYKGSSYGDDNRERPAYGAGRTGYGEDGAYNNTSAYGEGGVGGRYGSKKDSDGDGVPDEFEKSQYNREDVENLKDRTDIDDEEREHRRKVLMGEVAAGVVGAGVLGVAGYAAYQHFNKDDEEGTGKEGEGSTGFFGRRNKDNDERSGYGEGDDERKQRGYGREEEGGEKKSWF